MWFVRTYLRANLKISFKLKTFFLLQTPLLRIYSIEVKLPIHREYTHRDIIGAKILDILSGKNFVTKWVRAKPVGTGTLWKAERCARTPQIVTCHFTKIWFMPSSREMRGGGFCFFPWLTRSSSSFNSPVQTQITEYFAHICSELHSGSGHWQQERYWVSVCAASPSALTPASPYITLGPGSSAWPVLQETRSSQRSSWSSPWIWAETLLPTVPCLSG